MAESISISVIMITYGHGKYIEKAINGVLMQKTNFPVEFIIANDCSPDNSDEIIQKYLHTESKNIKIKYIKHDKNIGMNFNFLNAFSVATGKYIAICEGDDYWIDENKLQKQVDFLETHPDFSICCHNVYDLKGEELINETVFDKINLKENYTVEDLAKRNFIPTLSSVLRRCSIPELPEWLSTAVVGDYPLMLLTACNGKIHYINDKMGVYRTNVGIWSGQKRDHQRFITLINNLIKTIQKQSVKNILKIQKSRYIKLHLLQNKLDEILKSKYWNQLSTKDKAIVLVKKLNNTITFNTKHNLEKN